MRAEKAASLQSKFLQKIPKDMRSAFIADIEKAPDSAYAAADCAVVKNPVTATVLAFLFGNIGVGRFYIGDTAIGVAKIAGTFAVILFSYIIPVPQALSTIIVIANLIWKLVDIFLVNKKAKLKVYTTLSTILHSLGGSKVAASGDTALHNGVNVTGVVPLPVTSDGTYGKSAAIAGVEYFIKEVLESDAEVTADEENDGRAFCEMCVYIRQADKRAQLLIGTNYGGDAFVKARFGVVDDAESAKQKADGFTVDGVRAEVSDGELILCKTESCGDRTSLLNGLNNCLCGVLDCFDKPAFLELVGCVR